ncbi:RNA pyrophosphohydrolase [Devosia faecipullorum]|uniref:RNA pyrophosphohydrolase n=1 Tax=Devosia faecipullorum TaxID=2755039 RepID=UPI00187BBEE4|nr:RNA pyrophosphohydrolase [Devosia faecipullorum]MBE7732810.1 RNA pyrophosphohydrolase [Devosia faecipullorum]
MTKAPEREAMPYRDCVGIALFNATGQVFVGRRKSGVNWENASELQAPWQMPQGGIDKGEDPLRAALRELHEETNITSVSLLAEAPEWIYYDLPDDALGIALKGKYRGQRQRWFAFAFTGAEPEINVLAPAGGRFGAEFDAWRWERLSHTPALIVPFKRPAYEKVVAAFADIPRRFTHV